MLFNSFPFLLSLSILAVLYYALPHRLRWILLLFASLGFYSTFNPSYLLLLLGATLIAYVMGRAIPAAPEQRQRRILLATATIAELGVLLAFKYYTFFHGSLANALQHLGMPGPIPFLPRLDVLVPVGLSFYTFSCVSYLIDVYRGHLNPEKHFGHLALYVSFFPKLLAGPIERATTFLPQLARPVHFSAEGVSAGLQLILWGLFKKVVIADRLALMVDAAYQRPTFTSPADLVLATYFFAFQIYCDFSGYSDIAIGAARVLGFDLMENFRRPYFSRSVGEFWARRWHLSLYRWFRDYLYIPLGGSRVGRLRHYANVMLVFLASGLWHGANWTFVVWGGLNGVYQIASLITSGPRSLLGKIVIVPTVLSSAISMVVTFHLILISWVFFRANSITDALTIISRIANSLPNLPPLLVNRIANEGILLSLALVGALIVVEATDERQPVWESLRARPVYLRWAVYYILLFGLIVAGQWNLKQFVYMQF